MNRNYFIFISFFLSIISLKSNCSTEGKDYIVEDSTYRFLVNIPTEWKIEKAKNDSSFFRLYAYDQEKSHNISIYGYKVKKGIIDLEKFAQLDNDLFNIPEKAYKTKLISGSSIDKYYKYKNDTLIFSFRENFNIGYVLVYSYKSKKNEFFKKIIKSFKAIAPFSVLKTLPVIKNRLIIVLKPFIGNYFSEMLAILLIYLGIPLILAIAVIFTEDKKLYRILVYIIGILSIGLILDYLFANIWLSMVFSGIAFLIMIAAKFGMILYFDEE